MNRFRPPPRRNRREEDDDTHSIIESLSAPPPRPRPGPGLEDVREEEDSEEDSSEEEEEKRMPVGRPARPLPPPRGGDPLRAGIADQLRAEVDAATDRIRDRVYRGVAQQVMREARDPPGGGPRDPVPWIYGKNENTRRWIDWLYNLMDMTTAVGGWPTGHFRLHAPPPRARSNEGIEALNSQKVTEEDAAVLELARRIAQPHFATRLQQVVGFIRQQGRPELRGQPLRELWRDAVVLDACARYIAGDIRYGETAIAGRRWEKDTYLRAKVHMINAALSYLRGDADQVTPNTFTY